MLVSLFINWDSLLKAKGSQGFEQGSIRSCLCFPLSTVDKIERRKEDRHEGGQLASAANNDVDVNHVMRWSLGACWAGARQGATCCMSHSIDSS